MDGVEVFAPVVFEPYRPLEWPTSGSALLADLSFRVRGPDSGGVPGRVPHLRRDGVLGRAGEVVATQKRTRASRRPTGRHSWVPFPGRRHGWCATTTTAW